MNHKMQLRKLNDTKKKAIKNMISKSPIPLSKTTLEQAASNDENVTKIQESIDKLETIIEYLEKVEKLTSSLTWDCKNLIDLQKLETT
jgi:Mg2+ and Co2+ transporter CorA